MPADQEQLHRERSYHAGLYRRPVFEDIYVAFPEHVVVYVLVGRVVGEPLEELAVAVFRQHPRASDKSRHVVVERHDNLMARITL